MLGKIKLYFKLCERTHRKCLKSPKTPFIPHTLFSPQFLDYELSNEPAFTGQPILLMDFRIRRAVSVMDPPFSCMILALFPWV